MRQELDRFIRIADKLFKAEDRLGVIKPVPYEALNSIHDLELSDLAIEDERFEKLIEELVLSTPKTQTSEFFNQLFGGRRPKAYLGELLAVLLNSSMYTYKVGGPMIAVEKILLHKISELLDFKVVTEGVIAPGGSMTNYMGMMMARDRYDREARNKGTKKDLIVYSSEECHYSILKNAAFCGIGRDNVRLIPSDDQGRMRLDLLEAAIQVDIENSKVPCMINATSGTTVLGAFDDLNALADIRDRFGLWLHVDAAFGGSVMFSEKYKYLIDGAHRSDSFSVNAHKMLGTPLTCSIIITPHIQCLYDSFSNDASYLYQGDSDEINPGKISLQCGRRNDALKFWALWKSVGTKGLESMVDKEFELADFARDYLRDHPDYTLYSYDDSVNICFNYKDVSAVELCAELNMNGELMIGYGKFREDVFIRLVTVNANNTEEDILRFFKKLEHRAEAMIS